MQKLDKPKSRFNRIDKFLFYIFIILICFLPLPFGTNRPISWNLMNVAVATIAMVYILNIVICKLPHRFNFKYYQLTSLLFFIMIAWCFFQTTLYSSNLASSNLWSLASDALQKDVIKIISFDRYASIDNLLRIIAYGLIFYLAVNWGAKSKNASFAMKAILYASLLYGIYGFIIYVNGNDKVLFFKKRAYLESLSSVFINRNNYATYLGFSLIISLVFFFDKLFKNISEKTGKRAFIQSIQNIDKSGLIYFIASLFFLCLLLLTNSRAGIISSILGATFATCLMLFRHNLLKNKKIIIGLFLFFIILLITFIQLSNSNLIERLGQISRDLRDHIYINSFQAMMDNILIGVGLGNFGKIFYVYQDESLILLNLIIDDAHNSYLEMAVETGLPATIVFLSIFLILFTCVLKGSLKRKQNYIYPLIATCISVQLALHSMFDFSAEIPAISATYCLILAVGFAQSKSSKIKLHASYTKKIFSRYKLISFLSLSLSVALGYYSLNNYIVIKQQNPIDAKFKELKLGKVEFTNDDINHIIQMRKIAFEKSQNYQYLLDIGVANFYLANRNGSKNINGRRYLAFSKYYLTEYLTHAPSNSYAWLYLSYVNMLIGDDINQINKAYAMSIKTGEFQGTLIFTRLKITTLLYNYLTDENKEIFYEQIRTVNSRHKYRIKPYMKSDFAKEIMQKAIDDY